MSGIKTLIQIQPVRTLGAVLTFGAAVIVGLAFNQGWSGEAVGLISGGWSAFIGVIGTFFTSGQVTANVNVPGVVHDTIISLAPYAPEIVNAIVPVAQSPLLNGPKVVEGQQGAVVAERPVSPPA